MAAAHLTGKALTAWNAHVRTNGAQTWDALQLVLRTAFTDVDAEYRARLAIAELHQGRMTIAEYTRAFKALLAEICTPPLDAGPYLSICLWPWQLASFATTCSC
jgi:transposase